MKVFVINLDSQPKRFEFISKQLRQVGIDFERIPAVVGKHLPKDVLKQFNAPFRQWCNGGSALSLPEIGCTLSHMAIWRRVVDENIKCALILEDDVTVLPNIKEKLKEIEQKNVVGENRVYIVSMNEKEGGILTAETGMFRVCSAQHTCGYCVNPISAAFLLKCNTPITTPCYNWERWIDWGLEVYKVLPRSVAHWNRKTLGSMMDDVEHHAEGRIVHYAKRLVGKPIDLLYAKVRGIFMRRWLRLIGDCAFHKRSTMNKKIFILCPAGIATGGTEALHVLAHDLIALGFDAKMSYCELGNGEIVCERFKQFNVPYVIDVSDAENQSVVIPEYLFKYIRGYPLSQKYCWWLSVDGFSQPWKLGGGNVSLFKLVKSLIKKTVIGFSLRDHTIIHLCQSHYAMSYVKKHGCQKAYFLMDYLGDEFLNYDYENHFVQRENVVLYNPKKGRNFTNMIISAMPGVKFVPLIGMSPAQIRETCLHSKVYIDFGEHPGKDRFPREAALCGLIVITGRKGSAAFDEDVPIPKRFKIADQARNIPDIVARIEEIFRDYSTISKEFCAYRDFIREDKARFEYDLRNIFTSRDK